MMNIPEHLQSFSRDLTDALKNTLADSLFGVYIHGSLTYGGYVKERSDIDLLVLLSKKLTSEDTERLDESFATLKETYPTEVRNVELAMLLLSEINQRPNMLHSQYTFMHNEPKGVETLDGFWIELSNTRENGIVLTGPEPKEIIPEIYRKVLIEANRQKFVELHKNAPNWESQDLWNQTYILVQASRVLYSLKNDLKLIAKQDALAWASENAPEQFNEMLRVAQSKLDNFEGSREQVISDNWQDYFRYVEAQFKN